MNPIIYVIDDEKDIQEILKVNLINNNFNVETFSNAKKALNKLQKLKPDLIILDIMMPEMDGIEFCKFLKSSHEYKDIPILFLSAKSQEIDKVLGLELGADDYITKPFSINELLARIKAILRRTKINLKDETKILTYEGVTLYPDKYMVTIDGKEIELTKTEFLILKLFMQYPGRIFSRENIIDSIRGYNVYVIDRTVDVHIMNLRKKLGEYKKMIKTYSGIGYGLKQ